MAKNVRLLVGFFALATLSVTCFAAPFTPGSLVVYRAGDGENRIISDDAVPLFLDEYTTSGVLVQSLAMPTDYGPSPMTHPLTSSGNSGVGGLLSRSQDETCLIVPGYAALVGTENLINSSPTNIPRTIGVVWADGSIDTRTALTNLSNFEPRGVTSTDGYHLWTASGGTKGTPRYTTLGSSSSISVCTNTQQLRGINIYGGNLYVCRAGGGVYQVGSGLPTSSSNSFESLPGTEGASDMQCIFADLDPSAEPDTLYSVEYSGRMLSKYSFVGNAWTLTGSITGSYWRISGHQEGETVRIFAIQGTSNIVSIVDNAGYNAGFSSTTAVLLATAASNTVLRGIALSPGPWSSTPAPPTILVQPTNQFVALGATATFRVVASGYPTPRYQWRKNGSNIAGATNAQHAVSNVQWADDDSDFSVRIWNDLGSVLSAKARPGVLAQCSYNLVQPVSDPEAIIQQPGKDSLILITHGWQTEEPEGDNPPPPLWVTEMAGIIEPQVADNWQVVPLSWVKDAYTGPLIPLPVRRANLAYDNAEDIGARLGTRLRAQTWQHIHFIAHSAGGALIQTATDILKAKSSPPTIHETFLDPYPRSNRSGVNWFGKGADWADCYYTADDNDTGKHTDGGLIYAHNVEISPLDKNRKVDPIYWVGPRGDIPIQSKGIFSWHDWPHDFYAKEPSDSCRFDYGFTLSKEKSGRGNYDDFPRTSLCICRSEDEPEVAQHDIPLSEVSRIEFDNSPASTSADGISIYGLGFAISTPPSSPRMPNTASEDLPNPASETEGLSWIAVGVSVTSRVNYVAFDAEFVTTNSEPALLTIYWNTNLVGVIDESVESAGYHPYHFALPATYDQGAYTLGFELDAISNTTSSVSVTNVVLGYQGVDVPIVLDTYLSPSNNMPVLGLTGASNFVYYVDGSTNLLDWMPYAVLLNTNTTTTFEIPDSTNYNQMFYRGRLK